MITDKITIINQYNAYLNQVLALLRRLLFAQENTNISHDTISAAVTTVHMKYVAAYIISLTNVITDVSQLEFLCHIHSVSYIFIWLVPFDRVFVSAHIPNLHSAALTSRIVHQQRTTRIKVYIALINDFIWFYRL
jgi:hypothetical protein